MSSLGWSRQARKALPKRGLERTVADDTARHLIRKFGLLIRLNLASKRKSDHCRSLVEWYDGRVSAYRNSAWLLYRQFAKRKATSPRATLAPLDR